MASKHTIKEWYLATRPWAFPTSVMPVVVTLAFLYWSSCEVEPALTINWLAGALAAVGVVLFHAGGNVLSDLNDYARGVDKELDFMPLVNGSFSKREYLWLGLVLVLLGVAVGCVLVWLTGWPVLVVGFVGFVLTLFYPRFKYRALGDLNILLTFGLLPIVGTSVVAVGHFYAPVMTLVLPVGIVTVAVLHINNTRDIAGDTAAGIRTLAMLLGLRGAVVVYQLEVVVPYVLVALSVALGWLPWLSLVVFVTFGGALGLCKSARRSLTEGAAVVARLDQATSDLQLRLCLLLSAALVVATLV